MKKQEARKIFIEKRLLLTDREVEINQDLLLIQFQRLPLPFIHLAHSYLPLYEKNEPDPIQMINWLRFQNPDMQVAFPKINPIDFSMQHFLQDADSHYDLNIYGIPEPRGGEQINEDEIDLVIIPLLAFDFDGNRVGYGKGYYDRFLEKCRFDMIKVGISYFSPVDKIDDLGLFDKKLDFCITPDCTYAF